MVSPTSQTGQRLEFGVEWGACLVMHNRYLWWITLGQRGRHSLPASIVSDPFTHVTFSCDHAESPASAAC